MVVAFIDVTRLTEAQAHQQTLIAELNHRVKTMLMVVIGIAQQTHRSASTLDVFLQSFVGRLQAMARSYELLSRENWKESSLEELVRIETSPFGEERISISGPQVRLQPRHTLSLGMVLHELSTNSVKHGALSAPLGRVTVEWTRTREASGERIDLNWRESGGPVAPAAEQRGFGLRLIERETSYNLRGRATVTFADTGVEALISFSLEDR